MQAWAEDVDMMQVFLSAHREDAPDMMAVVLPDLDCSLLYANEAFGHVLGFLPHRLRLAPLGAGAPQGSHRAQASHDDSRR
jgi:hypothetical protein